VYCGLADIQTKFFLDSYYYFFNGNVGIFTDTGVLHYELVPSGVEHGSLAKATWNTTFPNNS
jgi:hypothetical protein